MIAYTSLLHYDQKILSEKYKKFTNHRSKMKELNLVLRKGLFASAKRHLFYKKGILTI